ncbi:hypothetical protein D7W82_07615 [Corallococcus sp. CA049B]|uniref:hypothetical protein n=1 Tax=Corallococcus sp. CA049B TaxID=2316730 RepID=UPI000EA2C236|nr:hypothetical protein [Corallococcus sp. CA049B]NOJ92696.1 hypothetical protein [Corallococcus coralloides]RKG89262.1 hypothetical protein D7W82_07615 [Corallococcus sp. CA049B]
MDFAALCLQIKKGLDAPKDRMPIFQALSQLSSPDQVPKLLQAWNLLYPNLILFDELARVLDDKEELQAWERLTGKSVKAGAISATTTASYLNLRATPGTSKSSVVIGKLIGANMPVTVHGKAIKDGSTWYLLEFSANDYPKVVSVPKDAAGDIRALYKSHRAWAIESAVATYVDYNVFMAQLRAFEMIHRKLSLKQRITLLRQMAHPSDLPFDTMIGTSGGSVYEETRPKVHEVYQLVRDAKAFLTPSGELVDIYHFIVGMDVYQKGRMGRERVKLIRLGESDPSATWAGDIGAGAADALLHKDKDYEDNHPGQTEAERILHYYQTRAPSQDLLGDLDAWGVAGRVDHDATGDTISSIIESVYGRGNATKMGTPQLRRYALENFFARHGLTMSGSSLVSVANLEVLKYYINDFGRVWVYRAQMKNDFLGNSFWLGSRYDKPELAAISEKMAALYLRWLDEQCRLNGLLPSVAPAARR